jgi:hypothetical protein
MTDRMETKRYHPTHAERQAKRIDGPLCGPHGLPKCDRCHETNDLDHCMSHAADPRCVCTDGQVATRDTSEMCNG